MNYKYLVALSGLLLGCGAVVPLQPSERAAVGWGAVGLDYCLEPSGVERAAGALVLASTYGVYQARPDAAAKESSSTTSDAVRIAEAEAARAQAQAQAIAELSLFARESLYRICEARRNGDLCKQDALIERRDVMAKLTRMVEAQATREKPKSGSVAGTSPEQTPKATTGSN